MSARRYVLVVLLGIVLLFLILGQAGFGQSLEDSQKPLNNSIQNSMAGFTLGNFKISSERFKEVFGKSGSVTGVEVSHVLSLNQSSSLGLSLEIRGFSKSGQSTVLSQYTQFSMTPVTLTGKYLVIMDDFNPFFGAGLDFFWYKEQSRMGDASGTSPGFHLEGGIYYHPPLFDFIALRASVRLSRAVAKENSLKVNLGGWEFGLAILYCFGI